jgi:hypothetical protein
VRSILYVAACIAGLVLALLGDEPLIAILLAAMILYPLATAMIIRADSRSGAPRTPTIGPAMAAGLAGTLLVVFLIRLTFDAPGWVDPTSADCGGPSTGVQQLAVWFAAIVFVLAAIPEAVAVIAIGQRLRSSSGPTFPLSLSFYPVAVACSGVALILVSFATTC